MSKSTDTRKKSSAEARPSNGNARGGDKPGRFAGELPGERVSRETSAESAARIHRAANASARQSPLLPVGGRFSAPQAAQEAGKKLTELTKLKLDSVSAVNKKDSGWQVTANLIELSRIPHSTDVLAAYEVQLDADGNLESYRRLARYLRDQIGENL